MKLKTLREGAKCPVDICSAPTGVERRRTAAMWKMSQKRPAAGGESSKPGFFLMFHYLVQMFHVKHIEMKNE